MPKTSLRRWWLLAGGIALTLLLMFFAASAAGFSLEEDPKPLHQLAAPAAALFSVALLVSDVVLPVPSSLVMIANGALFGVPLGALLSLIGTVGCSVAGFAIGRAGTSTIRRIVTGGEHERASALLARWGVVAIAVTRPVPILAETISILAGSSSLGWGASTLAAVAGSIVPSLAYAWAGAHARGVGNHALVFGGVLAVTGLLWWLGRGKARDDYEPV
jgi:uncharacterized membrane protein YdjX (TVP38/TMEM64 family)